MFSVLLYSLVYFKRMEHCSAITWIKEKPAYNYDREKRIKRLTLLCILLPITRMSTCIQGKTIWFSFKGTQGFFFYPKSDFLDKLDF